MIWPPRDTGMSRFPANVWFPRGVWRCKDGQEQEWGRRTKHLPATSWDTSDCLSMGGQSLRSAAVWGKVRRGEAEVRGAAAITKAARWSLGGLLDANSTGWHSGQTLPA